MHQVNLSDQLSRTADIDRARRGGVFKRATNIVADVLSHDLNGETPNLDHFFTPDRLAEIDQSLAECTGWQSIDSGPSRKGFVQVEGSMGCRDHPDSK